MSEIKFSKEQLEVINSRNRNLLVSAAAGSGKTAVLIERIISLITDKEHPTDLDRILVVTFTKAAAGEMKDRLSKKLDEMIENDPENEYLQRQAVLIHHAQINTIHGFCSYIIKNYFYKIDLDPVYRMMEEGEKTLLLGDVCSEMIEERYRSDDKDFKEFTENYFVEKKDSGLEDIIIKLYTVAVTSPWPKDWLLNASMEFSEDAINEIEDPEERMQAKYLAPSVSLLCSLASELMDRYEDKKRSMGVCDYSDLEQLALRILYDTDENGKKVRSDAACELSKHFEYIMTDEYQDSNRVQECILSAVSKNEDGIYNRFMVGDVKQSIYGFRQADPSIFLEKFDTYENEDGNHQRIDLHTNYRSRCQVVDTVNYIFKKLMTKELGGISYDEKAALNYGASYPKLKNENERYTEVVLMDEASPDMEGVKSASDKRGIEAELVAQRIIDMVSHGMLIFDASKKEYRPCRYSDIVILLRSVSGVADKFIRVFKSYGIPCHSESRTGYFTALEVVTVLNYLSILDNPHQDIPLGAVMFSPIGGFTADEMALIRADLTGNDYYTAALNYLEKGEDICIKEKLKAFFKTFKHLREMSVNTPVHELIEEIYKTTGYRNYAASMPSGTQREANLDMLVSKALNFEKTSYHGLFNFIRYIEKLNKYSLDEGEVNVFSEAEDTVRIMTVHKSKGLEFPVVFLCDTSHKFNTEDTKGGFLFNAKKGIGIDPIDAKNHKKVKGKKKERIIEEIKNDAYAENLRLLYVALTRAKEKLIITGICKDIEAAKKEYASFKDKETIPAGVLLDKNNFLDWLLLALSGVDEPFIKVHIETVTSLTAKITKQEERKDDFYERLSDLDENISYDPEIKACLNEILKFKYPYEALNNVPGKMTVTQLKVLANEDRYEMGYEYIKDDKEAVVIPYIPEFASEEKDEDIRGAKRGTAYHKVFEKLSYERIAKGLKDLKTDEDEFVKQEIAYQIMKQTNDGFLTQAEAESIDESDIAAFVTSPIGKRMMAAAERGELKREQPFTFSIPANEADPSWPHDQELLVQGIIDAYFIENGKYVIVDYKTDAPRDLSEAYFVDKYKNQLYYYARALEAATGIQVAEKFMYSTSLGKAVSC